MIILRKSWNSLGLGMSPSQRTWGSRYETVASVNNLKVTSPSRFLKGYAMLRMLTSPLFLGFGSKLCRNLLAPLPSASRHALAGITVACALASAVTDGNLSTSAQAQSITEATEASQSDWTAAKGLQVNVERSAVIAGSGDPDGAVNGPRYIERWNSTQGNARDNVSLPLTGANTASGNYPATGAPAIVGTATVGQPLTVNTAGIVDRNGLSGVTFSVQWQRGETGAAPNWQNISGAISTIYTVVKADENRVLRVIVSFRDVDGHWELLVSAPFPARGATVAGRSNIAATGRPAISGIAKVDEMLTADPSGIADGNGISAPTYSYQWQRGNQGGAPLWRDISGATAESYTLVKDDEGGILRVVVSFSDDDGYPETRESSAYPAGTAAVARRDNIPAEGLPTVSGPPKSGEELTASVAGIADENGTLRVTYAYQWQQVDPDGSNPVNVGANASVYTLATGNVGKRLRVIVSFTDNDGYSESRTSNTTPVITSTANSLAEGTPSISGTAKVGQVLMAAQGTVRDGNLLPNAPVFTYRWQRGSAGSLPGWIDISDASSSSYQLATDDRFKKIRVIVGFTDSASNVEERASEAFPSGAATVDPIDNVRAGGAPAISGTARVGQILAADPMGITDDNGVVGVDFTFQWQRSANVSQPSWVGVSGGSQRTYTTTKEDEGSQLRVTVSFQDEDGYTETVNSAPFPSATTVLARRENIRGTGAPHVAGTTRVGETLTAVTTGVMDENGLGDFTYAWYRADGTTQAELNAAALISTATLPKYTLVRADEGKHLLIRVSYTDGDGYGEVLASAPSFAVVPVVNVSATGAPTISGVPQVGSTLTVDASGIDDANGVAQASFSFQWQHVDVDGTSNPVAIGMNASTYLVSAADTGKRIIVTASFSDDNNYRESRTSDPTAVISPDTNSLATGEPTISGSPRVGNTLATDTSDIEDGNELTSAVFTYQWQQGELGTPIIWSDIAGATSPTYELTEDSLFSKIRVRTRFQDDEGNHEERFSAPYPPYSDTIISAAAPGETPSGFFLTGPSDPVVEPMEDATEQAVLEFLVSLAPPSRLHSTISYSLSGTAAEGNDYQSHETDRLLVFEAGEQTQLITIAVNSDYFAEGSGETVGVTLSNPTGALLGRRRHAEGRILEHPRQIEVTAANPVVAVRDSQSETLVTFDLSLSRGAPGDSEVEWRVTATPPDESAPSAGGGTSQPMAEGTSEILSGSFGPAESPSAVFPQMLPGGTTIRIEVQPLAARGGGSLPSGSVSAVVESASNSRPASTGGKWVVAVEMTVPVEPSAALVGAIASFGRSIATDIVGSVWRRAENHLLGEMRPWATVGGRSLDVGELTGGGAGQSVREVAGFLGLNKARFDESFEGLVFSDEFAGGYDDYRTWAGLPTRGDLASRTSFSLPLGEERENRGLAVWGEFSKSHHESRPDTRSYYETESNARQVGFDFRLSDGLLIGIAAHGLRGETDIDDSSAASETVTLESEVTSIAPYFHWRLTNGTSFWTSFGKGEGTLTHSDGESTFDADLTAYIAAVGARREIWRTSAGALSLKGDALLSNTTMDNEGVRAYETIEGRTRRARLAVEWTNIRTRSGGYDLSQRFELGARVDEGDAEEGAGADIAGEIHYTVPALGLELHGLANLLVVHSQVGFREWGFGFGAVFDPGASGKGASLALEPTWNTPQGEAAESMWSAADYSDSRSNYDGAALTLRLGYGAMAMREHALLTLYSETESGSQDQRLRVGTELQGQNGLLERLRFDLYLEQRSRQSAPQNSAVMLEARLGN